MLHPLQTTALAAALALAGLASCDSWSASTEHHPEPPAPEASSLGSGTILHQMVGAPQRTRFQGVRRYEVHWVDANGPQSLVYRETVSSDGDGGFAVDPLDLIEPPLAPSQAAQFLFLQKLRERLLFRYRDFEVRDLESFDDNYALADTGQTVTVAGRIAQQVRIQRRPLAECRYLVDVDPQNGLVLRAREELLDGTLVSLSEFETIDLSPDLSGLVFSQSLSGEVALSPGVPPDPQVLGFQPDLPKQVPSGWRLLEVAKLTDPTDQRDWAKLVYSDGVELLFYLEAAPLASSTELAAGPTPGTADLVRSLSIGAWTVLQGTVSGHEVVVMGKLEEDVLADVIRSAFP